ncbi:MAG: zf-HC2 domain-containing protein [Bacteroidia bacterium]|nr:zf-HC2 domain-containing protein [Bacteroidia bacterium]
MNHNSEKYKGIFKETDCLSQERLMQYHNGELTNQEMHEVEHHLLGCDLCNDALEGLSMVNNSDKIDEINRIVQDRVRKPASGVKWVAIAAMLLVFIGISTLLYQKLHEVEPHENMITEAKTKKKDSITPLSLENEEESDKSKDIEEKIETRVVEQEKIPEQGTKEESEEPQQIIKTEILTIATTPEPEEVSEPTEELDVADEYEEVMEFEIAPQEAPPVMEEIQEESIAILDKTISEDATTSGVSVEEEYNPRISATSVEIEAKEVYKAQLAESKGAREKTKINQQSTRIADPEPVMLYSLSTGDTSSVPISDKPTTSTDTDNFQIGLEYYKQSKFKKAIPYFDKVLQNKSNEKYENAKWFKALSLIELQKIKEARKLLEEIIDDDGEYKTQAEEKLREI